MVKHDGSEAPIQLTKNSNTYIFGYQWSPDGKKILYNTKKMELNIVDVATKNVTQAAKSTVSPNFGFNWSPDSKWIAFTKPEKDFTRVRLYNVDSKKVYDVTEGWYDSNNPSFSSDGKYLVFTSSRDFNPIYSNTEWNHAYQDMNKIYMATLAKDTKSPFGLENDEVKVEEPDKAEKVEKSKKSKDAPPKTATDSKTMKVDVDGIGKRIFVITG